MLSNTYTLTPAAAKSKISVEKFTVRVQGGIATLEGRTEVIQRKGTATRLAKLGGAKAVHNNIVVSEKAKAKAKANLAEGQRRAQEIGRASCRERVYVLV